MQNWTPDLTAAHGPKYLAIAEALAHDVRTGRLAAGDRLPPQRALAEALGVDLTTITRAYGEAQRLGLIEGDGRRGSFVRAAAAPAPAVALSEPVDTGMNAPPEIPQLLAPAIQRTMAALLAHPHAAPPLHYQPTGGMAAVRAVGARLLGARGIACGEDDVLVTAGGQHALHAIVSAELRAGDAVGVAARTYPGFLALARRYALWLVPIAGDAGGIDPDALDAACREPGLRALYVVPTNDNPTTITLDLDRRRGIAAVAERHGLILIEDDAYGLLPEAPLPPLASLAPARTWHVASTSKILTPGLRVAWARAPDVGAAWRLAGDLHETAIMAPPLNAALVASWAEDGTLETLTAAVRAEAAARQAIVRATLAAGSYRAQPEGYHFWMDLPERGDPAGIVAALRPTGLSVVAGDAFAVDPAGATPALRVSIGGIIPRDRLERALALLRALTGPDARLRTAMV
ncbi:PLP-dependent aminotransferase family protein [Sphingomonas sanxanigenens]|uniref:HTH gntR-type domain-containing protein n=1 Tax=Sphingomonas sanxanigenens DSM 19645 = NX02 TaxID=1123269 RepID=W0A7R6_9SPHN|nr:PLP-dependent aminotransferase family protein [Sphingomonas sanxanigenens]AHE52502.1 hypothetical protein NX02_03740 [Sphingomonas sanxanigenens DSM 19645 = NX02]